MSKTCPHCGRHLPSAEFGRNRAQADGLSFYCLECNRERNRRWYRESRRKLGREVRDHSWIPDGYRWCPTCERAVAHADYTRNARSASGFGSRCKRCHSAANADGYFYRQYGLTKSAIAALRDMQGDRCAICRDLHPQHLDHDHSSGRVRQLLCQRCNHGLGLFRDDPPLLREAARYVERHGESAAPRPARRAPRPESVVLRHRVAGSTSRERVRARLAALIAETDRPSA
ncbi:endonuclease domain-containing protein [Blastococcus sp. TF02A-26]|uniref:endonuclease domain-containing protein n=1 Tax=Blastococcus sp. TF02A-26 TaxID=2250577 RepID=UPI000DEBB641|nr:endonuclease domain-containing protein [Blastococcus sp. TF02A-26]RBY84752.1 recombination endonuclease VII [Blastococcus sp. TF02A-26]